VSLLGLKVTAQITSRIKLICGHPVGRLSVAQERRSVYAQSAWAIEVLCR